MKVARTFISELSRCDPEADWKKIINLVNALAERLGGIDGVAEAWKDAFQIGRDRGSPLATRCALAMLNLQIAIEANRPKLDMSPTAIEERLMFGLTELIEQHPILAVAAAERLGWMVSPPGPDQAGARPLSSGQG